MGGAKYVKAIKSVFPKIKMMPTGGVSLETVGELLKAGAFAVGVGSDLVDLKAIRKGEKHSVIEKAVQFKKLSRSRILTSKSRT